MIQYRFWLDGADRSVEQSDVRVVTNYSTFIAEDIEFGVTDRMPDGAVLYDAAAYTISSSDSSMIVLNGNDDGVDYIVEFDTGSYIIAEHYTIFSPVAVPAPVVDGRVAKLSSVSSGGKKIGIFSSVDTKPVAKKKPASKKK